MTELLETPDDDAVMFAEPLEIAVTVPSAATAAALGYGAYQAGAFGDPMARIEELERRLTQRGTDASDVIARRLVNARGEVEFADRYRYWVVNDDVDQAVDRLRAVILAEECRREAFPRSPLT